MSVLLRIALELLIFPLKHVIELRPHFIVCFPQLLLEDVNSFLQVVVVRQQFLTDASGELEISFFLMKIFKNLPMKFHEWSSSPA